MGRINVLDKSTSEKIAAGEVVERPSSVIKELVENAIDAGAASVTVEIKNGGITYMRVTDNGCGMDREDASLSFLRHATSKINSAKDLEHIITLGFRGEALCSISSVSRTEMFTKTADSSEGTHIFAEGGEIKTEESAGCPDGTTIVVRDLFYNTPARMKFLKKDSQEAALISDVCSKQALSHPNVSLRLIRDGKEVLFTPGDNILKNAVHCVLGKDIADNMAEVSYEKNGIKIEGLTGKNNLSRSNRLMEIFFVNDRCAANKTLYTALAEAYKNELMIGKFPVAVLNISLDPSLVDVNVHPSKTEVKFAFENTVYEALYWSVKNAVKNSAAPRDIDVPFSGKDAFRMPATELRNEQINITGILGSPAKESGKFRPYHAEVRSVKPRASAPTVPSLNEIRESVKPYEGKLPVKEIEGAAEKKKETDFVPQEKGGYNEQPNDFRIIGQLFLTYILSEKDGEFIITDQHAAHERLRYEEIKKNGNKVESQILLMPINVTLTAEEKSIMEENALFFRELGFDTEDFGGNDIVIRALPSDCIYENGADLLTEMISVLSGNEKGEMSFKRDKAVYTLACHSAVRANSSLSQKEMEDILTRVSELDGITTCPHGRPISIRMTKRQIEKMFGRIV